MKIKILQIGKNKDSYTDQSVNEFLKRLGAFCKIEIDTLKDFAPSKTFTPERCVEEEGSEILKSLQSIKNSSGNSDCTIVVMDERGKEFDSVGFSKFLQEKENSGASLCFVIGGPFGLSEKVKNMANIMISMSKMTLTHQMIRPFLLEQIFRGFCILRGKEYHH